MPRGQSNSSARLIFCREHWQLHVPNWMSEDSVFFPPFLSRPSFVRAKSASEVELLGWSRGSWLNIEKEWADKSIVSRAEYVLVCCSTGQRLKEHCQEGQENLRGPRIRSAFEQESNDPGLTSAAQEDVQPPMQKCRACDASGRCCCRGAVSVIIVLSEAPVQDR